MRAFYESNSSNLNNTTKLDKFLDCCTHSQQLFTIACNDQHYTNPVIQQQFFQSSLINTLYAYLHKLGLDNGPVSNRPSACHNDDDNDYDNDYDDSLPPRVDSRIWKALHLSNIIVVTLNSTKSK